MLIGVRGAAIRCFSAPPSPIHCSLSLPFASMPQRAGAACLAPMRSRSFDSAVARTTWLIYSLSRLGVPLLLVRRVGGEEGNRRRRTHF